MLDGWLGFFCCIVLCCCFSLETWKRRLWGQEVFDGKNTDSFGSKGGLIDIVVFYHSITACVCEILEFWVYQPLTNSWLSTETEFFHMFLNDRLENAARWPPQTNYTLLHFWASYYFGAGSIIPHQIIQRPPTPNKKAPPTNSPSN